jgi:hypothetical protein
MSIRKSEDVCLGRFAFKTLGFDAFELYAQFFRTATYEDVTFYGSFPLMMYKQFGFRVIEGYLFLFRYLRTDRGRYLYSVGLPINEQGERLDVETTHKCLDSFNGRPGGRIIHLHPALSARYPAPWRPQQAASIGCEYIYSNERLATLRGGEFQNLRKNVNRVASRYRIEIVPYEVKYRAEADRIYEKWRLTEGTKYDSIWDRTLFANLLDHYGAMEHRLYLVIDQNTREFIGLFDAVRISPQLAIGVLRKLDSRYVNLAKFCQVFLARQLTALGCPFLNDGDDAGGRPGLKQLKSSFHPIATYTPLAYTF